jgi:adenosylmethionine-8-amino-7-oxononanoate aminotransferase
MLKSTQDKKYVWHPYTQMNEWTTTRAPVITSGRGFYLVDENNNKYLDGISNMWCNVWGHNRNEIIKAVILQLMNLPHSSLFGLAGSSSINLAQQLIKMAKGMDKVFYTDNGSTAIEAALKMTVQFWRNKGKGGKKSFISLENGYHGDTIGCMSIGYVDGFFSPYRSILMKNTFHIPSPTIRNSKFKGGKNDLTTDECINIAEKVIKKNASVTAAFVMESGAQLAGGVKIYPEGFQKQISELCKKHEILLILDEIATGFGRLGNMAEYCAQRSYPDIVCYGKALTAGYFPLAVTLTTNNIFNAFLGRYNDRKQFYHGHTFTGHSVSCAAATANLILYKRYDLIGKIRKNMRYLEKQLQDLTEIDIVTDVRHKGLLAAIELGKNNKDILKVGKKTVGHFIAEESLKRGMYLRSLENIMLVIPPLAMGRDDLKRIIDVYKSIIGKIKKQVS